MKAEGFGIGFDHAPVPASLWRREADGVFRLVYVNEAACEFAGKSREELLGNTPLDYAGDHARGKRDMARAASTGTTVRREIPYFPPGGELRNLEVIYTGLGGDEVLVFVHDITSQRQAEERLRITEDRYRALISAANEGLWLVDGAGRTTFANAQVGKILGRPLAEIAGGRLVDFVDERDRASVA